MIGVDSALAQQATDQLPLYYVIERGTILYRTPDDAEPYVELKFREPVHFVGHEGFYSEVRTVDGAQGFVRSSALTNVWLRVSKSQRTVYAYRGDRMVKSFPADLGYNAFADKEQRGKSDSPDHWRTPQGEFFVVSKNNRSTFYRALVLNYPSAEDAERGLEHGIISRAEYAAILRAEANQETPPMNTALGGWIEIHGHGTGARSNWTQGCIAVRNDAIDELWEMVVVGTPVLIEP